MSGICSAHMGHDPTCSICNYSDPLEAAASKSYEVAFTNGVRRGIEATCEWLEGAQWDEAGNPVPRDPILLPGGILLTEEGEGAQAIIRAIQVETFDNLNESAAEAFKARRAEARIEERRLSKFDRG